jgi:hypothetical protein
MREAPAVATHTVLSTRLGELTVVKEGAGYAGGVDRKRAWLEIESRGSA